jgi:ribosomal protein S6--L-glutamate ligase
MKVLMGRQEWCQLPELGFDRIRGKVDTGANTSALHAENIRCVQIDGVDYVQFHVESCPGEHGTQLLCQMPLQSRRLIKSSNGIEEIRCVISTEIQIGTIKKRIDITLTDRKKMRFNLLLGRKALEDNFIIDPSVKYILRKKRKKNENDSISYQS